MTENYKKIGDCILVKRGERFGLTDKEGKSLLPCEYDSIFYEGGGFVIMKNSRSGYVRIREETVPTGKFAQELLPCIYDRIEPSRNGLVLCSMTSDPWHSEKRAWFDFQSEKIYENLHFLRNHGELDEFLDMAKGSQMPHLKRAGEEFYVHIPFDLSVSICYEISLNGIARYFVCSEELPEENAKRKGYGYEYFFMIVLPESYTFTEPKTDIIALFNDFPRIIVTWEKEAKIEKEHKEYKKERNDKDERPAFLGRQK